MGPVARVQDLVVTYSSTVSTPATSFSLASNEVVGLVGPSGSGKTTLLTCLAGLQTPTRGRVEVDGTDLFAITGRERDRIRRSSIGLVFQFGTLIDEFTIAENVAMPLRLLGVPSRRAYQRAVEALDRFGLGELGERRVDEVSGGQLQRAAIARALIHEPLLVLADEPSGSLDQKNAQLVTSFLVDHARSQGAAVIVATHDRDVAAAADRMISMDQPATLRC